MRELDFASALYLGMEHPSVDLAPWRRLTTGRPAKLASSVETDATARELARLQGCQAAVLATSTLHVFWDVGGLLGPRTALLVDAGSYAVGRWGVERAQARGARRRDFAHHDARALRAAITQLPRRARPVALCDGFCPGCGRAAPLPDYLEAIERAGGWLLVDDTQALGIYGEGATSALPYGRGGGGSLRRFALASPRVVLVTSLAKALGAPVAALSGPTELVERYRELAATREHCSPPSAAAVHAAAGALRANAAVGDRLRARLLERVLAFREEFAALRLVLRESRFPVQTLDAVPAVALQAELATRGIRAVLHAAERADGARSSFIVRAQHRRSDFRRAAACVRAALDRLSARPLRSTNHR